MYDRSVQFAQRYQLKKVEGTDDIFDLIPAPGTVNNEGTLINKAALLKDMTAALFGLTTDAVPDDVFKILAQAALYKTVTPTAQLSTLPEGSIIYLSENGAPVPFYVAKQGYEPDYNTGRVLLVRKDAAQQGQWNASGVNTYDGSTIDTWMNETYFQTLGGDVQAAIGTTNIPATSPYNSGVIRLNKAVFALSGTEYGVSYGSMGVEGTGIPIAGQLQKPTVEYIWARSPQNINNYSVCAWTGIGIATRGATSNNLLYQPAFTLPSTFTAYTDVPTTGLYDVSDNLLLKLPGVQIETGSYVGTGTYGSSNPNSLTFGFVPKLVLVFGATGGYSTPAFFTPWLSRYYSNINGGGSIYGYIVSFNETLSWYYDSNAVNQLNETATTYYYIAIG